MALGTVMVISAMPILPSIMASAARRASSGEGARTIGTRPTSRIRPREFSFDQVIPMSLSINMNSEIHIVCSYRSLSTRDTEARALEQALYFRERRPVEVARHRVLQRAKGVAIADGRFVR